MLQDGFSQKSPQNCTKTIPLSLPFFVNKKKKEKKKKEKKKKEKKKKEKKKNRYKNHYQKIISSLCNGTFNGNMRIQIFSLSSSLQEYWQLEWNCLDKELDFFLQLS